MNSYCGYTSDFSIGGTSLHAAARSQFARNAAREIDSEKMTAFWAAIERRFAELMTLEANWDGYGGIAVKRENIAFARSMLSNICGPDSPKPQIVPGPAGDLQVEWHTIEGDLELHVLRPNKVSVWFDKAAENDTREIELTSDFKTVAVWLEEITEAEFAAELAAA
ncbi:hypothetical protein LPN04_09115 [Rugamonas sp. A1-17]|nr:hypothetical protein [Rugamonas sp. A1-17]